MVVKYSIHPPIGVARVGNSPDFYLAPVDIGTRPIECNIYGDEESEGNKPKYVKKFKDANKRVRRQATKFTIWKYDTDDKNPKLVPVDLTSKKEVKSVKWTVHLANKKSAWYHFDQFYGDLLIDKNNTYKAHGVELRNADIKGSKRRQLIVDFGPRTVDSPHSKIAFKNDSSVPQIIVNGQLKKYPATLPYHQLERKPKYGLPIRYLGELRTDAKNNLVVLGGRGYAGGDEIYSTFAGGNSWYDDMSDGPVICELELADGTRCKLTAWVIVAPPKFAPELVNITTLDDIMFDIAIRHFEARKDIYDKKNGWHRDFVVNYKRDVEPIIKRIGHYRWVANVPSMMDFCMPAFDLSDNSPGNYEKRDKYFKYFRKATDEQWQVRGESEILFSDGNDYLNGIPLVPLNAGSNPIHSEILDKFVELTRTQYFFLEQWRDGKFTTEEGDDLLGMIPLDHADVGNCVGAPMSPGVEVTWSVRNPSIYYKPYKIKHKTLNLNDYFKAGLNPLHDETAPINKKGKGCEPGDLTKRMADPWQSDLFECGIQHVNFTDKTRNVNEYTGLEEQPLYHTYWWPPQSPWDVILGITDPEIKDPDKRKEKVIAELKAAGASAGQQVNFIRGIQNHIQMVYAWSYLGFIVNQNESEDREHYPYFVEKERNHEEFEVVAVSTSNRINIVDPESTKYVHGYYLKKDIVEFTKSAEDTI